MVLAINIDAAIRRLKGIARPVVSQHYRAAMLSALSCVNAVTIFDEDTPSEIIRCVRPDTLVMGQDYRLDEVIGRDIVEAAGGRVVLAPLLSNYSTTSLLTRARLSGALCACLARVLWLEQGTPFASSGQLVQ